MTFKEYIEKLAEMLKNHEQSAEISTMLIELDALHADAVASRDIAVSEIENAKLQIVGLQEHNHDLLLKVADRVDLSTPEELKEDEDLFDDEDALDEIIDKVLLEGGYI